MSQKEKIWGDPELLKSLKNPSPSIKTVHEVTNPESELTFFGDKDQPDYGKFSIVYVAKEKIIELKSLKKYLQSFRDEKISYERFIEVVYNTLKEKYSPLCLKVSCTFNPRGGLQSTVSIDSEDQD